MLKDRFLSNFEYALWANRRIRDVVGAHPRAVRLLNHVLAAENIWMTRLEGKDSSAIPVWPELSSAERASLIEENGRRYRAFIEYLDEADFERIVSYTNTKGDKFVTPVLEILTHVAFHGNYHRGQIAMILRDAGAEPVNTDYITFTRE